jgi:thiol reductant ABC exporter CydD subunit/thiol reductant ABC exporter CydC subunit
MVNAAALIAQAFLLASALSLVVAKTEAGIDFSALKVKLCWLIAVVVLRAGVNWATRVVSARGAAGTKEELRAKVIARTLLLGPEWIASNGSGQLTSLTTKGLDALDAYFAEYLPALVAAAVTPLGIGAAILFADWPSAAIVALTVPLLPLFAILIGKHTQRKVAEGTQAEQRLSGNLLEMIGALPVLAAFRRAKAQAETVRRVSESHRTKTMATLRVAFASSLALELISTLSVALVAVVIGMRLVSGDLTLVVGLGVLLLAPECYQPWRAAGAAFHASEEGVEAVRRVSQILAQPVTTDGCKTVGQSDIKVENLRVARRDGFAPDGDSFSVRPGELTWLRAPSGAGKSTILSVLLGFQSPVFPAVRIGVVPMEELDLVAWRKNIAWVPQTPILREGTVRQELQLACADLGGEVDAEEVAEILTEVNLAGLQDRSVLQLSLGQRQRVAVAKALVRIRHGAWLLLLDEPTAHLDAANAERVMDVVQELAEHGAAVLIAAHDRSDSVAVISEPSLAATVTEVDFDTMETEPRHTKKLALKSLVDSRLRLGVVTGALALLCGIALTATSGWLITKASEHPPILTLSVAVVGVRAFGLGKTVLRYAERLWTHDAAFRITTRLRVSCWQALVRLGPARILALKHGEGQRRLVQDIDTVRDLLPRVLSAPLTVFALLVGAIAIQSAVLPSAGLAVAAMAIFSVVVIPLLALRAERKATVLLAQGRRELSARVLSLLSSSAELIAFGVARSRQEDLSTVDTRLLNASRGQARGVGLADAVVILATGIAAAVSLYFASMAVNQGQLDPVLATVVALVPLALTEALNALPAAACNADTLRRARMRLGELAEMSAPMPGSSHASPDQERRREQARPAGQVEIRSADFRWPGAAEPVLREVNLVIPPGAKVALIGPSGAGKSTLLAALMGFITPERGEALLPARAAWAPQDPQLVSTTVAENLRLGNPTASAAELDQALRLAELAGLAHSTILGDSGFGLSGGQAQRLALARALLAAPNCDFVLLDEPTAHLDEATARNIRANLAQALEEVTVVCATHHLSEIASADLVVEVRDGRVFSRVSEKVGAPKFFDTAGRT